MRNSNGEFMVGLSKCINLALDPVSAEALAAYHVANFARNCGFQEAHFEADAMNVINLINRRTSNLVPFGHIINDVKRLSVCFRSCNWSFVRCCGNNDLI